MRSADSETAQHRASVNGRVAFVGSATALAVGLIVLIERIGAPEQLVEVLAPAVMVMALAVIGLATGSARLSGFYAAGRDVPGPYAGLAALGLAAGLSMPMVLRALKGTEAPVLLGGILGGLALAVLGTGPLVRQSGAVSLVNYIGQRFPSRAVRVVSALLVAAIGACVAVAGFETAVRTMGEVAGIGRWPAILIFAPVIAAIGIPGGLAGVVWAAAAAAALLLVSITVPVVLSLPAEFRLPLPIFGDVEAWTAAAQRIAAAQGADPRFAIGAPAVAFAALALGIGALPPLVAPLIATATGSEARRAGTTTLIGGLVLIAIAAATMALCVLAVDRELVGRSPDRLPSWSYEAGSRRLITLCGRAVASPAQAKAACASAGDFSGTVRPQDVRADPAELMIGLAQAQGRGAALSCLAAAAVIALGLTLSAAGLFVLAAALGQGGVARADGRKVLASPRLALTRALYLLALCLAAAWLHVASIAPEAMLGLAVALAAAALAPLLWLSLWPRAGASSAAAALMAAAAAGLRFTLGEGVEPDAAILARAAVLAFLAAVITGSLVSILFRRKRDRDRAPPQNRPRSRRPLVASDQGA